MIQYVGVVLPFLSARETYKMYELFLYIVPGYYIAINLFKHAQ